LIVSYFTAEQEKRSTDSLPGHSRHVESRWTCQVIGYKKTTHTDQCMHSGTSILWGVAHLSQYFAKGTNPSIGPLAAKCHKVVNASRILSGTYGQSCPNLVPEAMCTAAVKPLQIDYLKSYSLVALTAVLVLWLW